jgi:hypothetical protein
MMTKNIHDVEIREEQFFDWHEQIKKQGGRILRCWEITRGRQRSYRVIYTGQPFYFSYEEQQ